MSDGGDGPEEIDDGAVGHGDDAPPSRRWQRLQAALGDVAAWTA
jgi:hypothetical protein